MVLPDKPFFGTERMQQQVCPDSSIVSDVLGMIFITIQERKLYILMKLNGNKVLKKISFMSFVCFVAL